MPELPSELLIAAVEEYAIFMLDRGGVVATWNPGAQRIKGYAPEEILGRHYSVFYPEEDVAAGLPERQLEQAAAEGTFRATGWRIRKDGSRFWANVVITAVRDGTGEVTGFAKITRDETDRRQAEEQSHTLERVLDRERIAQALHESVVRRVFEASLTAESALGYVADPAGRERIEEAVRLLDDTLKDIRRTVLGLTAS